MTASLISRAHAREQELKRYYTGKSCQHGHVAERDVREGKCVVCVAVRASVRAKRWAEANPEKVLAKTLKWRSANPDKWRSSNAASKARNQKIYNEKQRQDYAANPAKYRQSWQRYYESRRDEMVIRAGMRRRREQAAPGMHSAGEARALLAAQDYRCIYCCADLRVAKRHLDHIQPLALGGSNDPSNLQWLCATCNLSKGARDPADFARSIGFTV